MESRKSLQRQKGPNSSAEDKWPSLAIIICTHQRVSLFKGALESFYEQTVSPDLFEVIVVDNDVNPTSEIKKLVSDASNRIKITYLHEPKLGLSNARNAGGQFSRADYFGYFDDDAKAPPQYVETLLQTLKEHSPDICGGPYYPFYLSPKPKWFKDEYGTGLCLAEARFFSKHENYLDGANIIFRRGLLAETGWFDPQLSMQGKRIWFGSETMVQINAWDKKPDLKVYFNPKLYVYHLVIPDKMTLRGKLKRAYQMGGSQVNLWYSKSEQKILKRFAPYNLILILIKLLIRTLPDILLRNRKQHPYSSNYVYEKTSRYFVSIGQQVSLIKDL